MGGGGVVVVGLGVEEGLVSVDMVGRFRSLLEGMAVMCVGIGGYWV